MSYFKRSILIDAHGYTAAISPGRQLQVATPTRIAGGTFSGTINVAHWAATAAGAGAAATVATGKATVTSGTGNNGYGMMTSVQVARYMASFPNQFRASMRVPVLAVADCTRRAGAFTTTATPQNGAYFEISPAGVLSLVTASGGVLTTVVSGAFTGEVTGYTLNTNMHIWEIGYSELGAGFYIDDVLLHTIVPTTAPLWQTPHFPINFLAMNSPTGVTSGTLECWSAAIMRVGPEAATPRMLNLTGAVTTILSYGPGTLHSVVVNGAGGSSVTLYDNVAASGTIIATITLAGIATMDFHGAFNNGLTVVTVGAGCNVTVVYG